jgi:DNA glycosylase AlkZ-like
VQVDGRDYWYARSSPLPKIPSVTVHLLPNYDEYGIAYKDRSAFYDPEEEAGARRAGIPVFRHFLLVNGLIRGTWDRTLLKDSVSVVTSPFSLLSHTTASSVRSAVRRYARFLAMPLADGAE